MHKQDPDHDATENSQLTNQQYRAIAVKTYDAAEELYNNAGTWSKRPAFWMADEIRVLNHPKYGKLLYLKQFIQAEVPTVFDILWTNMEKSSDWNLYIDSIKVLHVIDDKIDLIHTVTTPVLGGIISSRDFVDIRYFKRHDDGRMTGCFCSVQSNLLPAQPHSVRGHNGPNFWSNRPFIRKSDGKQGTLMEWIFNSDLKGNIPKSVAQKAYEVFLSYFARAVKLQAEK